MGTDVLAELEEARRLGFLGPGPLAPQLDHSIAFVHALEDALARGAEDVVEGRAGTDRRFRVADLGSGGGLPGLVLACRLPDLDLTLVESQDRRARFLEEAVERLGVSDRSRVLHVRAEDAGRSPEQRGRYDAVTARSFAGPAPTAECAAPLLREGGVLVVSEPPATSKTAVPRWPAEGLAALGMVAERATAGQYRFQVLRQVELCPDRFPRRVGIPRKRPLF